MQCPQELLPIILDILKTGIVGIRILGSTNNARQCCVEANHIHNLPGLIRNYSPALVEYYWNIERSQYIRDSSAADAEKFKSSWRNLEGFMVSL